ncbi:MAG: hypothetical protein ACKVW3_04240 [Phycisphaerales bacterium]
MPSGSSPGSERSQAIDVSDDGRVIVGFDPPWIAVRWDPEQTVLTNAYEFSVVRAVSGDGQTAVGEQLYFVPRPWTAWNLATKWLPNGTPVTLSPGDSYALAVSRDGSLVAGTLYDYTAAIWTAQGVQLLPRPPGETCGASAMTRDGAFVGGVRFNPDSRPRQIYPVGRPVMWGYGTHMHLMPMPRARPAGSIRAISDHCRVAVGVSSPQATGSIYDIATVWTSRGEAYELSDLLTQLGLGPLIDGWNLQSSRDVSADGRIIVGWGIDPTGANRGWRVELPSSFVCDANCDGSTALPALNIYDFVCFTDRFSNALDLPLRERVWDYANCDASTTPPVIDAADFTCFMKRFADGCG